MKEIINTESLCKNYGSTKALVNVSFALKPGIWGIIGPNGAGKTTLLNLLWNIIRPSSGRLNVLGQDPSTENLKLKQKIGVCFTSQRFPSGYVSKEYLRTVSEAYGISATRINPLIQYLLLKLEAELILEREIRYLSSGMKQKLAIVQCLMGLPEIAIMDEPFANLDPLAKVRLKDIVVEYHNILGTSFLVSSHSLEDLGGFCTGYLFIHHGRLLWKGTPDEVPEKDLVRFYIELITKNRDYP
ncbi:MAG: ABC transporter ATP-binding protein [Candidatus Thorarchaeota archaeon]